MFYNGSAVATNSTVTESLNNQSNGTTTIRNNGNMDSGGNSNGKPSMGQDKHDNNDETSGQDGKNNDGNIKRVEKFPVFKTWKGEEAKIIENKYTTRVVVTSYNPEVGQNDSTPCIGAHGTNVCALARSGVRTIAVSQDMRWKYKYGTTVWVESANPSIKGCYQVEDTMNKRWKNRIDLFFMTRKENQGDKTMNTTVTNSVCNPKK